ncbi:hypothetical protein [Stackebrandtia soli]|uniref:hypothetical protein n=1 Tax=Stackebrandtia soli TaxID=1892856 RepID=UPI0039E84FAE
MGAPWRSFVVGSVCVALVSACASDGPPEPVETVKAEEEPPTSAFESMDDVMRLCGATDGLDGHEDFAEYTGEGPHPIVIATNAIELDSAYRVYGVVDTEGVGNWGINEEHEDYVEGGWAPQTPTDAQLLACGATSTGEKIHTCEYEDVLFGYERSADLVAQTYSFTVYELRTGRVVDTMEYEAANVPCPYEYPDGAEASDLVSLISDGQLHDLFVDLVTDPARAA